jgi:hypothetical protein
MAYNPIAVFTRSTLASLKSLVSYPQEVQTQCRATAGDGGGGVFVFRTGDQSANVTNDPQEGLWAAPDSDPTGATGAWQRVITPGEFQLSWWVTGYETEALATSAAAVDVEIQAAVTTMLTYCAGGRSAKLYIPPLFYKIGASISFVRAAISLCSYAVIGGDANGRANILVSYNRTSGEDAAFDVGDGISSQMAHSFTGLKLSCIGTFATRKDPILFSSKIGAQSYYDIEFGSCNSMNSQFIDCQNVAGVLYSISGGRSFWHKKSLMSTTGVLTNTSPIVTSVSDTSEIVVGRVLSGTGIPANTTVLSVGSGTFTMSANATATTTPGSSTSIRIGAGAVRQSNGNGLFDTAGDVLDITAGDLTFGAEDVGITTMILNMDGASDFRQANIDANTDSTTNTLQTPAGGVTSRLDASNKFMVFGSPLVTTTSGSAVFTITGPSAANGCLDSTFVDLPVCVRYDAASGTRLFFTSIAAVDGDGKGGSFADVAPLTTSGTVVANIATPGHALYNTGTGSSSDLRFRILIANTAGVGFAAKDLNTLFLDNSKVTSLTPFTSVRYTLSNMWLDQIAGFFSGEIQDQIVGPRMWVGAQTSPFTLFNTRVRMAEDGLLAQIGGKNPAYEGGLFIASNVAFTGTTAGSEYPENLIYDPHNTASDPGYLLSGPWTVVDHNVNRVYTNNSSYTDLLGNLLINDITSSGAILTSSATAGIGYSTGSGGTVTQATNKSTAVSLNTMTGLITMNAAALNGGTAVAFTLNNTNIGITDHVLLAHVSAGTAGAYTVTGTPGSDTCVITVRNVAAGSLSQAIVIRFTILRTVNT